jgi:hypothetical protein
VATYHITGKSRLAKAEEAKNSDREAKNHNQSHSSHLKASPCVRGGSGDRKYFTDLSLTENKEKCRHYRITKCSQTINRLLSAFSEL